MPGVAIAAALVPPLSTVGITLVTGHYRESLGALLLFTTNLVAISLATALTFLMLGFRPAPTQKVRRQAQVRSVRVAFVLLLLVAGLLALTTYNLARESRMEARIFAVTEQKLREVVDAELAAVDVMSFENGRLQLEVTARSTHDIPFNRVRALQEAIGIQLKEEGILEEVALTLTVIRVTELDPLVPPTPTPVPSPTPTVTPGPSPTASAVPTLTPTVTATAVPTVTPLPTASPTSQPTMTPLPTETAVPPTPTPETAVVVYPYGLNFRAVPGMDGEILGRLEEGTVVVLLAGRETADNHIWQEIMVNGQIGWVASEFLEIRP
ncbi:MAG: DUF389 domain-containing protein [Chloroflexi bacterium]|nr:MAG: DUF389 domain-containing protein [Chloroflexota bacterium]